MINVVLVEKSRRLDRVTIRWVQVTVARNYFSSSIFILVAALNFQHVFSFFILTPVFFRPVTFDCVRTIFFFFS